MIDFFFSLTKTESAIQTTPMSATHVYSVDMYPVLSGSDTGVPTLFSITPLNSIYSEPVPGCWQKGPRTRKDLCLAD